MQKQDITKTVIKIGFKARTPRGRIVSSSFPVSLQQWIKKTPEEQEAYVQQHTKNEVFDYLVT